ncbi:MAG TPA: hypothetical protein GX696_06785 [Pseudomonadaceae bacterium]|nr:hypothetical protein [Pseudomonadaceae bacterium]
MHKYAIFVGLTACLSAPFGVMSSHAQAPDLSGIWMPLASLSEAWDHSALPLTQSAREALASFDAERQDSTYFCMPYGTPRNTLSTAPYSVEIIQTDAQLTVVFDRLGDVRRIFLDGRPHPDDPIPNWMGHSIGHWDAGTLVVETIAMTSESILDAHGLPHSDAARLDERWQLVHKDDEQVLENRLSFTDPANFDSPLTAVRYFRQAPFAEMSEGSSQCLMDQWRRQLEDINRDLFREMQSSNAGELP